MGVKGLLPLLEGIQKQTHLRNFAGQTLGVDAYGWLHRGTFACATDLAQGRPTRGYVNFAMNRVRMLLHFGVTPYVVFDGDYLPSKAHTERERAQRRRDSRQRGLSLLQSGKPQQAAHELQKSIDVTPVMARELIEELKAAGISYVVAPYEADSQLAYLEKQGLITGIISEDSDLLVFGASRLITKLDQFGECVMIRRQDFTQCREISLINWTDKDFRMMAMLSGCDYLEGIDGLGLKTAYRLVRKYKTIEAIVRNLQFDGKKKVPTGFLNDFYQADRTFLYQWVFCPNARMLVNLNNVPSDLFLDDMPYIGSNVSPELARGVAQGDLDPNTKRPLAVPRFNPALRRASAPLPLTPNLKSKKPISAYFKSQRTPLAELDPNSFTPSPSQQRLLSTQQNRSWSAFHTPTSTRSSLDATRRSSLQTRHSTAGTENAKSVHLSPRRKRFCTDVLTELSTGISAEPHKTVSPYFARKATKNSNFELFSDDSTSEAIHATTKALEGIIKDGQTPAGAISEAGTSTSPKKRKRLTVYQETSIATSGPSAQLRREQSTLLTTQSTMSQRSDSTKASFEHSQDVSENAAAAEEEESISDFQKLAAPFTYALSDEGIEPPATPAHKSSGKVISDEVVVHASSPPSMAKVLASAQGSEDILVIQSSSPPEDENDHCRTRPDLSRFLFAA